MRTGAVCILGLTLAACSSSAPPGPVDNGPFPDLPPQTARTSSRIKFVFVIAMENHSASQVYGSPSAPFINGTLLPIAGRSANYQDNLPALPSEPHYVWMEAGTNAFSDHTFTNDDDPSSGNSTRSADHVATQIRNANNGVTWLSYQEDLSSSTGDCPVVSSGFYAAKHNPFVFFQNVSGRPPSKATPYCAQHHRPLSALSGDLSGKTVAAYNFITPNLCHDMHGAPGCPDSDQVHAGDAWLQANLPPIIAFVDANDGAIFIVWDEPDHTGTQPFLVIGPEVKPGFESSVQLSHGSLVKSLEEIFGLPILPTASSANDFGDFFNAARFP
jgi:hypothetical protein